MVFFFSLFSGKKEKVKLGWGVDNRNLKLLMHEQEVGPTFICSVLACSTKCMEASGCCTFSFFAFPHFSGSSIQLPLDTRRPEAQTHTHRHAYSVVRSSSAQLYTLWMIGLQCTHVQEKEKGGGVRASRIIYICVCIFVFSSFGLVRVFTRESGLQLRVHAACALHVCLSAHVCLEKTSTKLRIPVVCVCVKTKRSRMIA